MFAPFASPRAKGEGAGKVMNLWALVEKTIKLDRNRHDQRFDEIDRHRRTSEQLARVAMIQQSVLAVIGMGFVYQIDPR